MKTFALAALAGLAAAQNWGTTGHYGNAYTGSGTKDHYHADHLYGIDSVPTRKDLKSDQPNTAGTARNNNQLRRDNIKTQVTAANLARTTYLGEVFNRKRQRITEIYNKNKREIIAPFTYQDRLLDKETDDVIVAMTEAINDAADAFTDMIDRLDRLF